MPSEKIEVIYKDSGNKDLIFKVLTTFFSLTFYKRLVYTFTYDILNYYYGYNHINKGRNVHIRPRVMFRHPERIYIGDNSRINVGCKLWAGKVKGIIKIGKYVKISPNVMILAFNHKIQTSGGPVTNQTEYVDSDVIIGDNVWIGANALILSGCIIGNGVVIAAGSVVTKDIPDNVICAGIPAKVIKSK